MTMLFAAIGKEFRLLIRARRNLALLFVMPVIFMLAMAFALQRPSPSPQDSRLVLLGLHDNPLNPALVRALQQQQIGARLATIHSAPCPPRTGQGGNTACKQAFALSTLRQLLSAGEFGLLVYNPNPADQPLADEQALALYSRPGSDARQLQRFKRVLQQDYIRLRIGQLGEEVAHGPMLPGIQANEQRALQAGLRQQIDDIASYLGKPLLKMMHAADSAPPQPSPGQHSALAGLIFGMFFIMVPLVMGMADERRSGMLARLRVAQPRPSLLLLSKMIPCFLINQCQFIGMLLLAGWLLPALGLGPFTLPGPLVPYALLSCAISLAALGYGLLVSVSSQRAGHALLLGSCGIILMAMLGGVMLPAHLMPAGMQALAAVSPMDWALRAFQALQLQHASYAQIHHHVALLALFGGACLILSTLIYQKQLLNAARR